MKIFSVISICFLLAVIEINLSGQNSSGWMGENRNGTADGFNVPDNWPDQLKKAWELKVGEGDSSPVLSNGRIYLHVKREKGETALCIDAGNGNEIWSTILNEAPVVTGPAAGHPGPRSTPFLAGGRLFTLGAGGIVNCLDIETGKIIWYNNSYKEVPPFFTGSSPLVLDNMCIVQLGGQNNGVVVAFDANSGKELWKLENVPCTYSSPVLMRTYDQLLLVQSETDLLGVSTRGELLWDIATPIQGRSTNSPTPIYSDNILIITGQGSGTKAYNLTKNGSEWEKSLIWSNTELGTSFNTPLIKDGYIYGHEERLGKIFCLNLKNGEKQWMEETTLNRFASILDLGAVLVSLSANGDLIAFEANGEQYVEIAKYEVTENEVYAHPLFVKDNIFIKDKELLTCWSIK